MERFERASGTPAEVRRQAAVADANELREARLLAERETTERLRIEHALRDSQARLHLLFDNALIGFFQTTLDGEVLTANPALLAMLGFESIEEMASHHAHLPAQLRSESWERLQRDGVLAGHEAPWTRKDGSIVYVRENSRIVRDSTGRALLYEGTLEDVTARRRVEDALRTSEARYRDLFENASDLIQSVTLEGRYRYVNPAWLAALGYAAEEVDHLSMWEVIHRDYHDECRAKLARLVAGESLDPFEIVFVAKNGERVFLEGHVSCRLEHGHPIATRGIFRDITSRRNATTLIRLQATALEESASAVVITAPNGTILWVNRAFTTMTGYTADEALGKTPRILKSNQHDDGFYGSFWEHILDGKPWRGQMVNRHKSGRLYHEQMVVTPLVDDSGRITHFVAIKEDISERVHVQQRLLAHERALAEAETRYKNLLENAPYAILISDSADRIIMANLAAAALLGFDRDDLIGKVTSELFPRDVCSVSWGRSVDTVILCRDGNPVPVEVGLSRETCGSETWTLRHVVDLRPRLAADKAKREFVSVVSHELRTPLTSITASLGLIAGEAVAGIPPAVRPLVKVAVANSRQLLTLIDDILDLERLEHGGLSLTLRTVDLADLVERALEANRGYASVHDVTLVASDVESPALVSGDPARLLQVLANLLSNAAKYSPRKGRVTVRLVRDGDGFRVEVHNDGPPVAIDARERIFERFVQADSSDARQRGGSGLGLSIAKAIIGRHGGTIGLGPDTVDGTTFYFRLRALSGQRSEEGDLC